MDPLQTPTSTPNTATTPQHHIRHLLRSENLNPNSQMRFAEPSNSKRWTPSVHISQTPTRKNVRHGVGGSISSLSNSSSLSHSSSMRANPHHHMPHHQNPYHSPHTPRVRPSREAFMENGMHSKALSVTAKPTPQTPSKKTFYSPLPLTPIGLDFSYENTHDVDLMDSSLFSLNNRLWDDTSHGGAQELSSATSNTTAVQSTPTHTPHIKTSNLPFYAASVDSSSNKNDEDWTFASPSPITSPLHSHPPPPIIWTTTSVNFLRPDFFTELHNSSSEYLLPTPTLEEDYFGHFTVLQVLGRGSFAEAVKVSDDQDRVFAIKRTIMPFSGYKDRMRRLEEVEVMWTLGKHPHCVELIDSWEQCGFLYLQLKFYDGGSLESYLQSRAQSPLPESLIWSFVADLALGLQHIHMHNYIHLDLKPSNIFLYGDSSHHPDGSWRLAIGDFGLTVANGCGDVDREGDRNYMAAEILHGFYSQAADIFSFGLIIVEMTAHITLPETGDPYHALRQGDLSHIDLRPETSAPLIDLITEMLSGDPSRRPTVEVILLQYHVGCVLMERK